MPEVVAGFAGWEPPREEQTPEEQAAAALAMGGTVLRSPVIPEYARDSFAEWQHAKAGSQPSPPKQSSDAIRDAQHCKE